jgi:hypothetical protein
VETALLEPLPVDLLADLSLPCRQRPWWPGSSGERRKKIEGWAHFNIFLHYTLCNKKIAKQIFSPFQKFDK